jgi:pimeloyl-ACP methyl ester carboxylesterase
MLASATAAVNEIPVQQPFALVSSTDGVTIPLFRLHVGTDRAILIAHATGFHGRVYEPMARAFVAGDAWAPDLRGHGDATSPVERRYHWRGFADDVLAIADWLDRPLFGFGHSMGGAALLLAEIRRPGTFSALYCWEPIVYPARFRSHRDSPLVERSRRRRDTFPSLDEAIANFAAKPPFDTLHPDALRAYVEHGFELLPSGERRLKLPGPEEAEIYRMSIRHQAFAGLGEVSCPVTVAHGKRDGVGPAGVAGEIAAALPQGRLEAWPDLGHFGPLEDPERVGRAAERALIDTTGS